MQHMDIGESVVITEERAGESLYRIIISAQSSIPGLQRRDDVRLHSGLPNQEHMRRRSHRSSSHRSSPRAQNRLLDASATILSLGVHKSQMRTIDGVRTPMPDATEAETAIHR